MLFLTIPDPVKHCKAYGKILQSVPVNRCILCKVYRQNCNVYRCFCRENYIFLLQVLQQLSTFPAFKQGKVLNSVIRSLNLSKRSHNISLFVLLCKSLHSTPAQSAKHTGKYCKVYRQINGFSAKYTDKNCKVYR